MNQRDSAGLQMTGANAEGLTHFETATHQFRCYIGDPVASVDAALAAAPQMVMGHTLKAYLYLLGTEPLALPMARESVAAAADLAATERERGHVEAVRLLAEGRWSAAGRVLEDVSIAYPRDALALQAGHQIDFFRGDSRMLRDRIARVLPVWSKSIPGYHALLGMHAFGLEETGDYAQAEKQGRTAVELRAARHLGMARGRARLRNAQPAQGGPGLDERRRRRLVAKTASSRFTIGGTRPCTSWKWVRQTRRCACSTDRSSATAPASSSS